MGHHSRALNVLSPCQTLSKDHASCHLDELSPLGSALSAAADGLLRPTFREVTPVRRRPVSI
jgi:hypothetical protein